MSSEVFERLYSNLKATRELYQRLLELAERKQRHILESAIDQLRQDLMAEERLAAMGTALQSERTSLHAECARALGADVSSLGELCRLIPQPWKERFEFIRDELGEAVDRLHSVNRVNAALVNGSLELMEGLLAALFDAESAAAYDTRGGRAPAEYRRHALEAEA